MEKGRKSRSKTRTGKRSMHQHHGVDKMDTAEDIMQADSDDECQVTKTKRYRSMAKAVKVKVLTPKEQMNTDQPRRLENYDSRDTEEKFGRDEKLGDLIQRLQHKNGINEELLLCKSTKGGQLTKLDFVNKNFEEFFDNEHLGKKGKLYVVLPYGTQLVAPSSEKKTETMSPSTILQVATSFLPQTIQLAQTILRFKHESLLKTQESKRLAQELFAALTIDIPPGDKEDWREKVKIVALDIIRLQDENNPQTLHAKLEEFWEKLGVRHGQEDPSSVINGITIIGDNFTVKEQDAKANLNPPPTEKKGCTSGRPHTVEEDCHSESVEESTDSHPVEIDDSQKEGKVWEGPALPNLKSVDTTMEDHLLGKANPLSPSTIDMDKLQIGEPPTLQYLEENEPRIDHSYSQAYPSTEKRRGNTVYPPKNLVELNVDDDAFCKELDQIFPDQFLSESPPTT